MSNPKQLAKIVEFLERTRVVDVADQFSKVNKTGVVVSYLLTLPINHKWNVDEAVAAFEESMKALKAEGNLHNFDPKKFLILQYPEFSSMNDYDLKNFSLEQFNEKFFGFDTGLVKEIISESQPEPEM